MFPHVVNKNMSLSYSFILFLNQDVYVAFQYFVWLFSLYCSLSPAQN